MFFQCLSMFASWVWSLLSFNIPGTSLSFLSFAVGAAFLPVLINVFARIFGGTVGVDTAIKTMRKIDAQSDNGGDDP